MPTSAKDKTTDADTVETTPNDVETLGDEVRIDFCPSEPRSYFDGPLTLVEDDVFEASHRDLDTRG